MNQNTPSDEARGLTLAERQQIRYLLRFLGTILLCVIVASLIAVVMIAVFQNGG